MNSCRICNNANGNKTFNVREMMIGLRESFEYFECRNCGCIQISDVPAEMEKYYPKDYYSFNQNPKTSDNFIVRQIKYHRSHFQLVNRDFIGFLISKASKTPVFYEYFKTAGINLQSRILDVGCGYGKLLLWMKREGFINIMGIDPFIKKTIHYSNGLTILKNELNEIDEQFDFIMLHHSFEHIPNQNDTLKQLNKLLKPSGHILIRIPVAAYAWKNFGVDWIALDAPRHCYLHTLKSMEILAQESGLKIKKVFFDSFALQFWGSIQYQNDIPLMDPKSYLKNKKNSMFNNSEIQDFSKQSELLNKDQMGDAAGFYLKKS